MTKDTNTTSGSAIKRYKIGYHTDEWGMRSSTPSGIPDHAGAWVRYEDHIAALVGAQQPGAAYAALPDDDRDYMRKVVAVAVTMLFDGYKGDVTRVFSTGELSEFVTITAAMGWERVEDIYRRAWDLLSLPVRASHGQAPAAAPAQVIGPCVICGSDEPFTGTCGSGDPRALCKQPAPTPQADSQPAPQPSPASQGDELDAAPKGRCQHCIDRHDGFYGSWAPPCPYHDDDGNLRIDVARAAQEGK